MRMSQALAIVWQNIDRIRKKVWENVDGILKCVQIVAILVAGVWAWQTFVLSQWPLLVPIPTADLELDMGLPAQDGSCTVTLGVTISNEGKRSFRVTDLHLTGIRKEPVLPQNDWQHDTDATQLDKEKSPVLFDIPLKEPLTQEYVPGAKSNQTYTWFLKERDPGLYFFKVEAFDGKKSLATATRWTNALCPPKE